MSSEHLPRPLAVAPFLVALAWSFVAQSVAAQAARGFAQQFGLREYATLLAAVFFLFLLLIGFTSIDWIARRRPDVGGAIGLPMRAGFGREWAVGAATGWGMVLAAVLPLALSLSLQPHLWWSAQAAWATVLNLAAIAIIALAEEMVFRGYPYRMLIDCIGPTWATLVMSTLFALAQPINHGAPGTSFFVAFSLGLVLSMGYLRTHALWLPWGLHFAWIACMGVLFGLPVSNVPNFAQLVEMRTVGPLWLTGGNYGLMAAPLTLLAIIAGAVVLYRATRDYAWNYTQPPIVPAGYPMEAPTPAAHAAMEAAAAAQPLPQSGGLVQILPLDKSEQ